jgi:hypothetical protein
MSRRSYYSNLYQTLQLGGFYVDCPIGWEIGSTITESVF